VAGPKRIVDSVRTVREQLTICNNSVGEAIALAVLKKREEVLESVRHRVRQNFEALKTWMRHQDILEWVEPEGGVVCFPRLKNGQTTENLCRMLVTKYRTFTIPGYCFDMDRHLRIGFGGEAHELKEGLNRLGQAMEECRPTLAV
jgi:aspartate/methionine/tyrosine aminotransferase